jgi:hypothetical protein
MDCLSSAVSNSLTFFTHDLSFFLFIFTVFTWFLFASGIDFPLSIFTGYSSSSSLVLRQSYIVPPFRVIYFFN